MQAKNKWNSRIYNVIEIKDNEVTLERTEDYCEKKKGTFTISKSEYFFSYFETK